MAQRTCRICRQRRATLCDSCGPHQSAPDLRSRGDVPGLRAIEEKAQAVMAAVDSVTPPGWGVVIFWAQYGQKGYASYVSTMDRTQLPAALREFATQIEERSDRVPGVLGEES